MPSREDIDQAAQLIHRVLTRSYYRDPEGFPGGKAAFDMQHAAVWENHKQALIDAGLWLGDQPDPLAALEGRLKALEDRFA